MTVLIFLAGLFVGVILTVAEVVCLVIVTVLAWMLSVAAKLFCGVNTTKHIVKTKWEACLSKYNL